EIVYGAAGGTDGAMQAALRRIEVFGDAVEGEVRIAQVIGDIGADAVPECAARGLAVPAPHLLLDGEVDDLRDRFRQYVGTLGVDGSELFHDPTRDAEHEPANSCRAGEGAGGELLELDVFVQAVVRN